MKFILFMLLKISVLFNTHVISQYICLKIFNSSKVLKNSFSGFLMRKPIEWQSLEIVLNTKHGGEFVEKIYKQNSNPVTVGYAILGLKIIESSVLLKPLNPQVIGKSIIYCSGV